MVDASSGTNNLVSYWLESSASLNFLAAFSHQDSTGSYVYAVSLSDSTSLCITQFTDIATSQIQASIELSTNLVYEAHAETTITVTASQSNAQVKYITIIVASQSYTTVDLIFATLDNQGETASARYHSLGFALASKVVAQKSIAGTDESLVLFSETGV